MASNGKISPVQGIRDNARHKQWKKFDSIITTLIAMDASPTDLEERLRSGERYLNYNPITSCTKLPWCSSGRNHGSGRKERLH